MTSYEATRRDRVAVAVANWWLGRVCTPGFLARLAEVNRRGLVELTRARADDHPGGAE